MKETKTIAVQSLSEDILSALVPLVCQNGLQWQQ